MASIPGREHVRRDARFRPFQGAHVARDWIRRSASALSLVAIDLLALILGTLLAFAALLVLRGEPVDFGAIWVEERRVLPLAAVTIVIVFARARLYLSRERRVDAMRIVGATFVFTLVMIVLLLATGARFTSYAIFASAFIVIAFLAVALRASYGAITAAILGLMRVERRVVLVGAPGLTGEIAGSLQRATPRDAIPYRVVGTYELVQGSGTSGTPPGELVSALASHEVDEVIIAGTMGADAPLLDLLERCRAMGIPARLAPTATDLLTHTLRAVAAPGLPLFDLRAPVLTGTAFYLKRVFDVVAGTLILLLVSPLLLVSAIAIKLDDRGPVLFRSRRVGVDEVPFDCLKLRTMAIDAEDKQKELESQNEADGALFKIKRDPRVTRVGGLLRRFSLDELPQLFNVLRGEMSLVGPRPLPERDFALLDDVHKRRYLVLPGMTGLWQVSGRSELSFDELVRLDFSYIESWSVWLDIEILLRTIPTVLFKRGAY